MSEFAWFKLLVRLVGILLLGLSVPMLLWHVGSFAAQMIPSSPMRTSGSMEYALYSTVPGLLGYGAQATFGWYLLVRGDWVIRKVLAEIHGRCAVCGFDLTGVKATSCPECNTPVRKSEQKATEHT